MTATLPITGLRFPLHFETPLREGPRQEQVSSRGPGRPGGTGAPKLQRGEGDTSTSGSISRPQPALSPILENPVSCQNPSCPGLAAMWLVPAGQASRCPFPSQGWSSGSDDAHTAPTPLLTGASAPDSCCALHPQAQGRELGSTVVTGPSQGGEGEAGLGERRVEHFREEGPQRTKGCSRAWVAEAGTARTRREPVSEGRWMCARRGACPRTEGCARRRDRVPAGAPGLGPETAAPLSRTQIASSRSSTGGSRASAPPEAQATSPEAGPGERAAGGRRP